MQTPSKGSYVLVAVHLVFHGVCAKQPHMPRKVLVEFGASC